MTDDIHTKNTTVDDSDPGKASGEVRSDAAGKQTGPAGSGDLDQDALDRSRDELEKAGGGH